MTHATSVRTAPRQAALFSRLTGRIHSYIERRRTRRLLLDLDEHMRRDIGLTPGDDRIVATDAWLRRW